MMNRGRDPEVMMCTDIEIEEKMILLTKMIVGLNGLTNLAREETSRLITTALTTVEGEAFSEMMRHGMNWLNELNQMYSGKQADLFFCREEPWSDEVFSDPDPEDLDDDEPWSDVVFSDPDPEDLDDDDGDTCLAAVDNGDLQMRYDDGLLLRSIPPGWSTVHYPTDDSESDPDSESKVKAAVQYLATAQESNKTETDKMSLVEGEPNELLNWREVNNKTSLGTDPETSTKKNKTSRKENKTSRKKNKMRLGIETKEEEVLERMKKMLGTGAKIILRFDSVPTNSVPVLIFSIVQEDEPGLLSAVLHYDEDFNSGSEPNSHNHNQNDRKLLSYPLEAHPCTGSTNVVWKSQLFFISGTHPDSHLDSVVAFDTKTGDWNVYKPIGTPRYCHTAVAVRDSIYVFSGTPGYEITISEDHWLERFDILKNTWHYIPNPPKHLHKSIVLRACAVYYNCLAFSYTTAGDIRVPVPKNQNLILFPLPKRKRFQYSRICVFNCNTDSWLPDIRAHLPESAPPIYPCCSNNDSQHQQAVVDDVLFWYHGGSIHGYDFIQEEYLPCLFTLPDVHPYKPHSYEHGHVAYPPSHLLHPGGRELVFIFQYKCKRQCNECNKCNILYKKFRVQPKEQGQGPRIHLVSEAHSLLSASFVNPDYLQDVIILQGDA